MHILDVLNAHTNTNIVTIPLTVRYTEFQESKTPGWWTFHGLIDTGALQGNYMSYEVYQQIDELSVNFVRNNNVNTTVCTAFNDCQLSTDSLTLPIHFNYNTIINLNQFELVLTFIVLKTYTTTLLLVDQI